jgi:hypothetical protein
MPTPAQAIQNSDRRTLAAKFTRYSSSVATAERQKMPSRRR